MTDLATILRDPGALSDAIDSLERSRVEHEERSKELARQAAELTEESKRRRRDALADADTIKVLRERLALLRGEPIPDAGRVNASGLFELVPREGDEERDRDEPEPLPSHEPTREAVLRVMRQANRPMRTREVHDLVPQSTRKTVGWWMWKLAEDPDNGPLIKLRKGLYVARTFEESAGAADAARPEEPPMLA